MSESDEHSHQPHCLGLEPPRASGAQLSRPVDDSAPGCETSKGKGGGHQLRLTGAGAICWPGGETSPTFSGWPCPG